MKKKNILITITLASIITSIILVFIKKNIESFLPLLANIYTIIGFVDIQKTKIYDHNNTDKFYDKISKNYDSRNTQYLKHSHFLTVDYLKEYLKNEQSENIHILDLGGGTGLNIASPFFAEEHINWTYVDSSFEMKNQFEKNTINAKFNKNIIHSNIEDYIKDNNNIKFDIIILSFVLTSMPGKINFDDLKRLLKTNGQLIITEIEPEYTINNPNYTVTVDKKKHSLQMNPVNSLELLESAIKSGLNLIKCKSIKKDDGVRYSYIVNLLKV